MAHMQNVIHQILSLISIKGVKFIQLTNKKTNTKDI